MFFIWEGAVRVNNFVIKMLFFFRKKYVIVFFFLIRIIFFIFWVGGWLVGEVINFISIFIFIFC